MCKRGNVDMKRKLNKNYEKLKRKAQEKTQQILQGETTQKEEQEFPTPESHIPRQNLTRPSQFGHSHPWVPLSTSPIIWSKIQPMFLFLFQFLFE